MLQTVSLATANQLSAGQSRDIIMDRCTLPTAEYDMILKLIIVGDSDVGKSWFLLRFTENDVAFTNEYINNFGAVEFKMCNVCYHDPDSDEVLTVRLQMWDTNGYERYRTIVTAYYRGAHGIILAFDVTDRESFDHILGRNSDIESFAMEDVAVVLVGMKADQSLSNNRVVSYQEGEQLAVKLGGIPYVECSSKDGAEQVNNVMRVMVQTIVRSRWGAEKVKAATASFDDYVVLPREPRSSNTDDDGNWNCRVM